MRIVDEASPEDPGQGDAEADAPEDTVAAVPSTAQTLITYGIGVVIGLIIGIAVLSYLCRRKSPEAVIDVGVKTSPSTTASTKYSKLATAEEDSVDIERGRPGIELSSRGGGSKSSSPVGSLSDDVEGKNWDDWEENGETGEFEQHSKHVGSASSLASFKPSSSGSIARSTTPEALSQTTNSSSGSLNKLGTLRTISPGTSVSKSPKTKKLPVATKNPPKTQAALGDDLFEVHYLHYFF
jgi:hypothetical protein